MSSVLVPPKDYPAYQQFKLDPATNWASIAREIAGRHGLTFESAIRFSSGENPVLNLDGLYVIKLVPVKFWPLVVPREVEALTFMRGKGLPVADLLGHGEIDGWEYLICRQLPGESFATVWRRLDANERRRAAYAFGVMIGKFHQRALNRTNEGEVTWRTFVQEGIEHWFDRGTVKSLPPVLRESGLAYLRAAKIEDDDSPFVLLHGDLAPENCLATPCNGGWDFSGVFDFGNSFIGRATFDLAAPTVLLAPLDAEALREFVRGYGRDGRWLEQQRHRLMAYTLLHPLGNAAAVLKWIPGGEDAKSWDEIASKLWPSLQTSRVICDQPEADPK